MPDTAEHNRKQHNRNEAANKNYKARHNGKGVPFFCTRACTHARILPHRTAHLAVVHFAVVHLAASAA